MLAPLEERTKFSAIRQPNPTMTLRRYAGILASMEEGLEQRQQEHFVSVRSSVSETCHETPADVIPMASGR